MSDLSLFSEKLKELIGRESVSGFAFRAGVSEGTIRNLLKGGVPNLDSALRIAEAGEKELGWMVGDNSATTTKELTARYSADKPKELKTASEIIKETAASVKFAEDYVKNSSAKYKLELSPQWENLLVNLIHTAKAPPDYAGQIIYQLKKDSEKRED